MSEIQKLDSHHKQHNLHSVKSLRENNCEFWEKLEANIWTLLYLRNCSKPIFKNWNQQNVNQKCLLHVDLRVTSRRLVNPIWDSFLLLTRNFSCGVSWDEKRKRALIYIPFSNWQCQNRKEFTENFSQAFHCLPRLLSLFIISVYSYFPHV